MAGGAVNFFLDAADDPLLPDGVPAFDGGQFSNLRGNLLQPNQSKLLQDCDVDKLGKLRTRRGTIMIGGISPSGTPNRMIQGLTSYQTKDYNYIVCANDRKLWQWTGATWVQIATGGVADNDDVLIYRKGAINNAGGYPMGTTVLTVDGITGIVGKAEKLYFLNNLRNNWFEYTIASAAPAGEPAVTITLEEPGLVFDVKNNWRFVVARPAQIDGAKAGGYTGAITIKNYGAPDGGTVNIGEDFIIKSENVRHTVTAAGGGPPTTSITSGVVHPALQADWLASTSTVPIVFAQGNDLLYFTDGVGSIYAWNGKTTMNISQLATLDFQTGSALHQAQTAPPTACKVLLWATNRLIASGIDAEPDAIYFSDFFDGTSWDRNYQKMRIGGGESDPITGLLSWMDINMLVFKKNSIYIISLDPSQNPVPDDPTLLVASYAVRQIHKLIGCPAPRTAVQVGGSSSTPGSDVFFLDENKKVHSVRRVLAAEQQQEIGLAISLPVQDVLDTIDIANINTACAMYHNEHYILGIPSMNGLDTGGYPNTAVVYNMLTQTWCGTWSWFPTCFARRTDLGGYSKLIFGDWRNGNGRVLQWLDDQSFEEETEESYQEFGSDIHTVFTTRAITLGDFYSYKTGLNVEFEFDESEADGVIIKVIIDKITQTELIAPAFSTLSVPRLILPLLLPFTLPPPPSLLRKAFDLQRYGTWRELQFSFRAPADKLSIRSIRITAFIDTMRLQTLPGTGIE